MLQLSLIWRFNRVKIVFMDTEENDELFDSNGQYILCPTKTGFAIKRLKDSKLIRAFVIKADKTTADYDEESYPNLRHNHSADNLIIYGQNAKELLYRALTLLKNLETEYYQKKTELETIYKN
jgi:hypothetical protein